MYIIFLFVAVNIIFCYFIFGISYKNDKKTLLLQKISFTDSI